jgi:hypothetical protein
LETLGKQLSRVLLLAIAFQEQLRIPELFASKKVWVEWCGLVLLVVFGAIYYWSYAKYGLDPDVEGQLLLSSASVLDGRWPTADFLPSYGLLYCGLAVFFKLFGITVLTERIFLIVLLLATGLLAYFIARQVMPARWAAVPPLLYILVPGMWHKVFFIFSLLVAVAGMFLWLRRDNWRTASFAGVLTGTAFAIRWEPGVLAFFLAMGLGGMRALEASFAGPLSFRLRKLRSALLFSACFIAGAAVPISSLAALYWSAGKLAPVVAAASDYMTGYPQAYVVHAIDSSWFGFNARLPFLLGVAGSAIVLSTALFRLWQSGGEDRAAEARILLAGSALAGISYQMGFWWGSRVLECYVLAYIVWELIVLAALRMLPISFRIVGIAMLALILGEAYVSILNQGFQSGSITNLLEPTVHVDGVARLGGVRPFSHTAPDIVAIVNAVAPHRQERTIVPTSEAVSVAFLTGLPDVTRYHGLFIMSECEQETAIETFDRVRPYIVLQRQEWETDPAAFGIRAIFEYLHRHYTPIYNGSWYMLLDRLDDNSGDAREAVGRPKC